MTRRKSLCLNWTLVLVLTVLCPFVLSRPQGPEPTVSTTDSNQSDVATEHARHELTEGKNKGSVASSGNLPRDVKTKTPVIGESMQVVANQLLQSPNNGSVKAVVADTRIPPRVKNQVKQKVKTRHEDGDTVTENFHSGEAVPVTMEELETENQVNDIISESSTSNEGISTWILLSNTGSNSTTPTEPTKPEETQKKKPNPSKNKNKKPQNNKTPPKRPIIGSTNKSDLVASGSAINENVYNKLKDTVLSNVQKNKSTPTQKTTTTTTMAPTTEEPTTRKEIVIPVIKVTPKPQKKKNKNKNKSTTTIAPVVNESALLPMEAKEQEIELEVSTPPTTTKRPKRTSTKKRNKTKKRKTSKPKNDDDSSVSEIKTSNKTKTVKNSKKPATNTTAISSQIYNYLSREVMPSVGVGVLGLASLVGIASYFFYPFATPVRRTIEVDKKDDLYLHNAEEYGSEGNGQPEEEMLGTVLAGMPAHAKQKLNPYAGQTMHVNRYPAKKEENIRYRHVTPTSYNNMPNYNVRYPQQKTGIAHGAVYHDSMNYNPYSYETRHVQTTEGKFSYDKVTSAPYSPAPSYPAVEPIYAAPQTGSSASSYGDPASSVVYGIKPSSDSDFKPVYPYESQFYNSETTSNPNVYPSTSMYLGSNNENDRHDEKYEEDPSEMDEGVDNKFVVGNVPKELSESATPAVVPEHGPRKLNRRRRGIIAHERSIAGSIEDILKAMNKEKDVFISNEIDDIPRHPSMNIIESNDKPTTTEVYTEKLEVIESVSTLPLDKVNEKSSTESEYTNQIETTTRSFKVYEVFPDNTKSSSLMTGDDKAESTTVFKNMNTETTTENSKSETTSTMPPSPTSFSDPISTTTKRPYSTPKPEVLTYPPIQDFGFFGSFLRRLVEFKYKLGLSILQTTSDSLNRYLRNMEKTVTKATKKNM